MFNKYLNLNLNLKMKKWIENGTNIIFYNCMSQNLKTMGIMEFELTPIALSTLKTYELMYCIR